jgi:hypothetical protein
MGQQGVFYQRITHTARRFRPESACFFLRLFQNRTQTFTQTYLYKMTKKKKAYVAPVTDSVELKTERILCTSPDPNVTNALMMSDPFQFNSEIEW